MYIRKEKAKCIIQNFENESLKHLANDIQLMRFLVNEIENCKKESTLFCLLCDLYEKAIKIESYYYNLEYSIENDIIVYEINRLLEDNQEFFCKVRDILIKNNLA